MDDGLSQLYLNESLTYTEDGRLMDSDGNSVMMEWERPIMEKSAEIICRNKGRVLNVGFGMGIIDSEIQKYDVDEHWIIEVHPDVYQHMFEQGWHLKKNVRILLGDWRWYLPYLPKFDGVFIDTWDEEIAAFHDYIPNILNGGGIYSFFNNPRDDEKELHMTDYEFDILNSTCNIAFEELPLTKIDSPSKQLSESRFYWHPTWKTYYCPVLKLKENVSR
jgi:type IV protein arginine methyltransferase